MKPNTQQGFALVLTLVLLAIMLIGGLAMLRSNDASARVAGNISFQAAATKATDIGVSEAGRALSTMANTDTNIANQYYATRQAENADGILSTVNWSSVASTQVGNFTVQRVIERMCTATPVTDPSTQCMMYEQSATGSKKSGSLVYDNLASIYYRVTVRVTGPKNTVSFVQALMSK